MEHNSQLSNSRDPGSQNGRPTIGLLNTMSSSVSQQVWLGAVDAARTHDINLICFTGGRLRDPDPFAAQANILYELADVQESAHNQMLSGFIIWASVLELLPYQDALERFLERFRALPVVTIGKAFPGIPAILLDNTNGIDNAIRHLIEKHECRQIAFIRGPEHHAEVQERYKAYVKALTKYGLPFEPNLVSPSCTDWIEGGVLFSRMLDEHHLRPGTDFDAVIAPSSATVMQIQPVLQSRGILIPEDIAVIGFDDVPEMESLLPPVTTVNPRFYEVGWQSIETVLKLISKEPVPEKIIQPSELIVRESCGCFSSTIAQTAIGLPEQTTPSPHTPIAAYRHAILTDMQQTIETNEQTSAWVERIFDSLMQDLTAPLSEQFLSNLRTILHQATRAGNDIMRWQNALSVLRRWILHFLETSSDTISWKRFEDLCQQARILVGDAAKRAQASKSGQAVQQHEMLQELGARLITTFDIIELMNVLAEDLSQLEIPGCYVALYEDPQSYEYPQSIPPRSRLILAYHEHEWGSVMTDGRIFPSRQLVPEGMFPQKRQYAMIVKALYFRSHQIGFAVFELGPWENDVYETMRRDISSALYGAQLIQRIQARSAEIARQKYILDTFMENIPDSIYFKDLDSRIFYANHSYAGEFGLNDPEEEVGRTDFDFFPEEQARRKYEQEQAIIRTGQPLLAIEEPQGKDQWFLTTKMPLRNENGEIIGTFGISRNITELKRTQQELARYRDHLEQLVQERTSALEQANALLHQQIREGMLDQQVLRVSEQQYRLLAESVQDGILIVQAGKLVFANTVFTNMIGYSPEQLMDLNPVSLFHASADPIVHDRLIYGDNEPPEHWQAELITKEGQTIWTEIAQNPMVWNGELALLLTIRNVTERKRHEQRLEEERSRLERENLNLKSTIKERYRFGSLVGKSPAMQRVYELLVSAASSDVNVLIFGESGTGKEIIARTLHQVGLRKNQAFVPVNCASIPETLFEREFFGHRKGAFTGANRDKPGLFDRAHKGILFLDEVTELNAGTQAKLLRVLQDGEYIPLGSTVAKTADVQIVAATNQEPHTLIERGRLRKDFFYRIGVIEITVPPLRERKDDLPLLIEHILDQYRQRQADIHGNTSSTLPGDQTMLPTEFVQALYAYHWPGNVRELQNLLQRYLATGDISSVLSLTTPPKTSRKGSPPILSFSGKPLAEAVKTFEKQMIADTLALNQYNIRKTAEALKIPLRTLYYKINAYHLKESEPVL